MRPQHAPDVELINVRVLRLVESVAPPVPVADQMRRDEVWEAAVRANPTGLFDGPVVVCTGLERGAGGTVSLSWAPVTYRHFALRRVPGAEVLPSMFVAVAQPTDEGGLLVGRMSPGTAAPGRLQLPGGSVEPPADHGRLDLAALARHAAQELWEEIGILAAHEDLCLWVVTRGEYGNVGVFFRAPSLPEALIRDRFQALLSETVQSGDPELQEITFVRSVAELDGAGSPQVDYLSSIVDLHTRTPLVRRG
jgi:8-oxo-dGTP pyrophosphatase MutT (NUDIX family)